MKPARVFGPVLALGALLAIVVLYYHVRPGISDGRVPDEGMPSIAPRIESPAPAPNPALESSGEQASAIERAPAVAPPPAAQQGDLTLLHVQVVNIAGAAITQ